MNISLIHTHSYYCLSPKDDILKRIFFTLIQSGTIRKRMQLLIRCLLRKLLFHNFNIFFYIWRNMFLSCNAWLWLYFCPWWIIIVLQFGLKNHWRDINCQMHILCSKNGSINVIKELLQPNRNPCCGSKIFNIIIPDSLIWLSWLCIACQWHYFHGCLALLSKEWSSAVN